MVSPVTDVDSVVIDHCLLPYNNLNHPVHVRNVNALSVVIVFVVIVFVGSSIST